MALQVGAPSARAQAKLKAAKSKDRRQKIVLGALSGVLLMVMAFELPSLLSKPSGAGAAGGGGGSPASTTPAASAAATMPAVVAAATPEVNVNAELGQLGDRAPKDPFVAQVSAGPAQPTAAATSASTPRPPAVRLQDFVAKDPFVAQISEAPTSVATSASPTGPGTSAPGTPLVRAAGGYRVVLGSLPSAAGARAASRAVVAAENAGLVDVQASLVPQASGQALEVYTGPYAQRSVARQALTRALRVGYARASLQTLHGPSPSF